MGSKTISILIILVTLGLLGGGGYYMNQYLAHQPKKISTYQDILLGDSKDQVFYALGKPSRVLLAAKQPNSPEIIVGKESLEKNPDHEKGYNHWQYLSGQTVTDVLFDSESKKTITIGCSKLSAQPPFAAEPPPETPAPVKSKKNLLAPPVAVGRPLTPAEAAEAPATDNPPGTSPAGVAGSPPPPPPAAPEAAADSEASPTDGSAEACNIDGVKIGDTEKEVFKRLGRPKKEAYNGVIKTIFYPNFNLAIKMEKRVVIYIMVLKEVISPSPEPVEDAEKPSGKEK